MTSPRPLPHTYRLLIVCKALPRTRLPSRPAWLLREGQAGFGAQTEALGGRAAHRLETEPPDHPFPRHPLREPPAVFHVIITSQPRVSREAPLNLSRPRRQRHV